ncbi:MAG: RecQ family ATP-dependent DNA helicase, partial [bacterium]
AMLQEALGAESAFRHGQWESLDALVNERQQTLVVQATGWGKSVVYFLASKALQQDQPGFTLILSPLLSLMRNQVWSAERFGLRSGSYNSSLSVGERTQIAQALRGGMLDLLLVAPEQLGSAAFREDILTPLAGQVRLLVVDEAHCISDWGHDFRPDYQRIRQLVQQLPSNLPVLLTTATANDTVVNDIRHQLGAKLAIQRGPLNRASLHLAVHPFPTQEERLAWLASRLPKLPGSGIVYALTQRDTEQVAAWLKSQGLAVAPYHGGMANERAALETKLLNNELKALVATSALGMGFDKPDLGFVVHFQRPKSVIDYYQQIGRAGRAVDRAYAILLCGIEDDEIARYFIDRAFPTPMDMRAIRKALEASEDGLSAPKMQTALNIPFTRLEGALKLMAIGSPAPIVLREGKYFATPIAWEPDIAHMEAVTRRRYDELSQMQEFAAHPGCLMEFLRTALDDPASEPCGQCMNCRGGTHAEARMLAPALVAEAQHFLRHQALEFEARRQWADRKRIDPNRQAETGRALCLWGDAGWGQLVKEGKWKLNRFHDELVDASAALIREQVVPLPAWVTAIPTFEHQTLVPDFAERLAAALGLPYVPAIVKTRPTKPQKDMANSAHQLANIEGAFRIDPALCRGGAVLLVDDIRDSGWTLTVAAAQLREAGSGPVVPFVLALQRQSS